MISSVNLPGSVESDSWNSMQKIWFGAGEAGLKVSSAICSPKGLSLELLLGKVHALECSAVFFVTSLISLSSKRLIPLIPLRHLRRNKMSNRALSHQRPLPLRYQYICTAIQRVRLDILFFGSPQRDSCLRITHLHQGYQSIPTV